MKRFCSQCLLYEGMPLFLHPHIAPPAALPVRIEDDGRCSVCTLYARRFSQKMIDTELKRFEDDDGPTIVLYSGGKDSTATLAATVALGRETHALLFDNGLIPPRVIDDARAICARLDVPLTVATEGPDFRALAERVGPRDLTPCETCARTFYRHAIDQAERTGARYIVQGTNYFSTWQMFPLATRMIAERIFIHLPYARGQTAAQTRAQLDELGVAPHTLSGVSSNCRLPGLVQLRLADTLGHVPELEDLSLEIIAGHLTRAEALETLRARAPEHAALIEGA